MTKDLTQGKPGKVILLFAVPIIIGNICQQIYNLVDTIIVGRFVNFQALAGIGAINGLNFCVLNFLIGFTGGLGILVAQHFGSGNMKNMRRSVATSLVLSVIVTAIMTTLALIFVNPLLNLIRTPSYIYVYSYEYISIIFAGLFSQVAYNIIASILRALGDSRTPLYFLIFASLLNICLDLLFILKFGMGIRGAAIATVISQMISAVLCFIYAYHRYPELRLGRGDFSMDMGFTLEHLRISFPMAFQFSVIGIGIVMLQYALNDFPATYIAGFTAASKIENVFCITAVSIGVAMASYSGQNFGAGKLDRIRNGVNSSLLICLVVYIIVAVIMVILGKPMTNLFLEKDIGNNAEDIYYASNTYLMMCVVFFPFLFPIFVYRNALQGMGYSLIPLISGFLELILRTVTALTLPLVFGYVGIVLVDASSWVGACLLLGISYYVITAKLYKNNRIPSGGA